MLNGYSVTNREFEIAGRQILVTNDKKMIQVEKVHQFLSNQSYWAKGVPLSVVRRSIDNSLSFAMIDVTTQVQIGFVRVVTDLATFAWICDVFIETDYRGLGLSMAMLKVVFEQPELIGLRRLLLATVEGHGLYRKFGFEVTKTPERWMEIKDPNVYAKKNAIICLHVLSDLYFSSKKKGCPQPIVQ